MSADSPAATSSPSGVPDSTRHVVLWLLPVLLLPILYEISAWRMAGVSGFPLDDAWIHAQFARNLATGHGFTYTGSRWVAGSTAPVWTMLVAVGFVIMRSVLLSAKLIGLLFDLVSAVLAAKLVYRLTNIRGAAIVGGLVVGTLPAMAWGAVSGMEIPLSSSLVLGGFYVYLTGDRGPRRLLVAVGMFCLASLARPENLVLLGIVAIHAVVRSGSPRASLKAAAIVLLVSVTVLGPFVLFNYVTTGRPLPTTYYAKSGPGIVRAIADGDGRLLRVLFLTHGPTAVRRFVETLFDQVGLLAILVLAGAVAVWIPPFRRRGTGLLVVSIVVSAFAMGLVAPQRLKPENFRYTAQLVSLAAIIGVAGLSFRGRRFAGRAVQVVVLALWVAGTVYCSVRGAPAYGLSVKNIQELHVTTANWMRAYLPSEARIAVNDIGALAFFGGHEIIDLEGLVLPEALAFGRVQRGMGIAEAMRPDYIVIFPNWYPDIVSRTDLFHQVHSVSIADNIVSAGSTLVVYSTPWTRFPPLSAPAPAAAKRRWPV